MAATNVRFTEYVNVFLPSSKVSADVAHRTFAGAQPAASLSRPQPSESEPDTARQPQKAGPPTVDRVPGTLAES